MSSDHSSLGAIALVRLVILWTDGGLDRIADGQDFAVQDVIHEAFITVDEKGTETAAATAVIVGPTSIPPAITINHAV